MAEIRHTGIYVEDLDGMKDFYVKLLKAKEAAFSVEEGSYIDKVLGLMDVRLEIYKIQAENGGMIELLKYCNPPATPPTILSAGPFTTSPAALSATPPATSLSASPATSPATSSSTDEQISKKIWEKGQLHIAVTVEAVDDLYRELLGKGICFLSEPCISPDHRAKVCFCRDPEGNFLELVEVLETFQREITNGTS